MSNTARDASDITAIRRQRVQYADKVIQQTTLQDNLKNWLVLEGGRRSYAADETVRLSMNAGQVETTKKEQQSYINSVNNLVPSTASAPGPAPIINDQIVNSLTTSLAAYNAAAPNTWVTITSSEYSNLVTNVTGTLKAGIADTYLTAAAASGLTAQDKSAFVYNTASAPYTQAVGANQYLYAFAVKYGISGSYPPATDARVFTNTNTASSTGFNQVGSVLPALYSSGSGYYINYFVLKSVSSTNGATAGNLAFFTGQTSGSGILLSFYQNFSVTDSMQYVLFTPGATGGIPNSSTNVSGTLSGYGAFAIQALTTPTIQWN